MRVLHDVYTNDELISDGYLPWNNEWDGLILEVMAKYIMKGQEDYGISNNAEEGEEGLQAGGERVLNIVDAFHYTSTQFNKKDFANWIKMYMQKLKKTLEEKNPDRVKGFMTSAQGFVKKVMADFSNYEF